MKKEFNSIKEKDAYCYERIKEYLSKGMNKSTAINKVKVEICDISVATTYVRYRRERRRKEVSNNDK